MSRGLSGSAIAAPALLMLLCLQAGRRDEWQQRVALLQLREQQLLVVNQQQGEQLAIQDINGKIQADAIHALARQLAKLERRFCAPASDKPGAPPPRKTPGKVCAARPACSPSAIQHALPERQLSAGADAGLPPRSLQRIFHIREQRLGLHGHAEERFIHPRQTGLLENFMQTGLQAVCDFNRASRSGGIQQGEGTREMPTRQSGG